MTRDQIAIGLEALALQLANATDDPPPPFEIHEWAYIKGLATGVIMQLRDRLKDVG